ncbi:MAG TPA: LysM peptidoglycan-binding domain-containing protein [Chloroflexota bacterium]
MACRTPVPVDWLALFSFLGRNSLVRADPITRVVLAPARSQYSGALSEAVSVAVRRPSTLALLVLLAVGIPAAIFLRPFSPLAGPQQILETPAPPAASINPGKPIDGPLPATYVVQAGDTLAAIADQFDSFIDVLRLANNLEDLDLIRVNETLVTPPPGTGIQQVDATSTLIELAATYRVSIPTLAAYNGMTLVQSDQPVGRGAILLPPGAVPPHTLAPGFIDIASGISPVSFEFGAERPVEPTVYEVRPGDNLTDIAWRLGIDIDTIVNNNGELFDADLIRPGDHLLVLPVSGLLYRVEPGDTLSGIVDRFAVEVDPILEFNRIENVDLLQAGLQLILPGAGPSGYFGGALANGLQIPTPYRSQLDGTPWQGANCGPVTLGMGLDALGIRISSTELRRQALNAQGFSGNNVGTLIDALARVATRNGARPIGLFEGSQISRWSLDDLRGQLRLGRPVIVQVRYRALPGRARSLYSGDHYIILTGRNGDSFLYNDPMDADGPGFNRQMTASDLARAMDASDRRFAYAAFSLSK